MSYGTISNEWLNKNNLETLWAAIVRDFVHAGASPVTGGDGGTTKGSIPYWGATSTPTGTGQPIQPMHLQIGSVGQFIGVSSDGIPQWTTPQILQSGGTDSTALTLYLKDASSVALSLQVAGPSQWGIVTDGTQTFGGDKTFNGHIHGKKNIEAEWGVSAEGIADLSLSGGGGGGTVSRLVLCGTAYDPENGIITVPASQLKTDLGLGAAAYAGIGTVASGQTGLVSGDAVNSAINAALTAAMKIEGETTTTLVNGSTTNPVTINGASVYAYNGMVVFYNSKEFVWTGSSWKELGDESSFALKLTTITGTGYLTGGGSLAENRTIDISDTAKGYITQGQTAYGYFTNGILDTAHMSASNIVSALGTTPVNRATADKDGNDITTHYAVASITTAAIGQVYAMATDNADNITLIDGRVGDIESYFDGSVALVARKLETARSIWGKSFDGTADITGAMSYVTNIDAIAYFDTTNSRLGIGTSSPDSTLHVAGTFKATGNSVIGGTLGVTGATTLSSTLGVTGATTLSNTLTVAGATTLQSTLGVTGATTLSNTLTVAGATTLQSTLAVSGNTTIGGTLTVSEDITGLKNIQAHWGVSAQGIADMSLSASGGGGSVIGAYVNGETYTTVNAGILTLPNYPTASDMITAGLASQSWVSGQISALSLGTASTHAHSDYVTDVTWDSSNRKLKKTHGGDSSATDLVQFGTVYSHGHDEYVTAVGISGTNLSVTKGSGTAVLTAINAATLEGTAKSGLFTALTTGTTNAIGITIGGTTKNITASDLRTSLNIGQHSDYVTALGVSGNTLTWSKGGVAQTAITVPYATNSDTVDTHHASEFVGALGTSGDDLTWTKIGGSANTLTVPYATTSLDAKTELKEGQEFAFRQTGGGTLTKPYSSGVIKRILGNTVVWNQRADLNNLTGAGTTRTKNTTGFTSSAAAGSADKSVSMGSSFVYNHVYYVSFDYKSNLAYNVQDMMSARTIPVAASWTHNSKIGERISINYSPLYWYLYATTTETWNLEVKNVTIIDLTLFFNGNIPENLTPDEFEQKYRIEGFYEPNAGTLINNACSGLESVGFNLWDEEWENGYYNVSNGNPVDSAQHIRGKNYIKVSSSSSYYIYAPEQGSAPLTRAVLFYDLNKNFISSDDQNTNRVFTTPSNCSYVRFYLGSAYGAIYKHDTCINLSDSSRNGQYEPYRKTFIPLGLDDIHVKSHNIWDEEWENGTISQSTGENQTDSSRIRSKSYIPVVPGSYLHFYGASRYSYYWIFYYDENKQFILGSTDGSVGYKNNVDVNNNGIVPTNARYLRFYCATQQSQYANDICINLSSSFNGRYEPHGILTINGLKGAGSVCDEIVGSKYIKRIGRVELGSFGSWSGDGNPYYIGATILNDKSAGGQIISKDIPRSSERILYGSVLRIYSSDFQSLSDFNYYIQTNNPVLDYELATPIEYEIADNLPTTYPIDILGTESIPEGEMVAPFKADIQYGAKQKDFALDINSVFTGLTSRIDAMDISHYQSSQSGPTDTHVITINGKKLYLRFSAVNGTGSESGTLPSFNIAVADNDQGENEQEFNFATMSESDITTICHL